jgi:hypothetical protein
LASLTDRLFSEVDRQLAEVRAFADGVATRAGLLVSASALTAGLLGSQLATIKDEWPAIAALVALGGATLFGIFVFAPGLTAGPAAAALGNWAGRTASAGAAATNELYSAKLIALEANRRRLTIMRVLFYLQSMAVVISVIFALLAAGMGEEVPR